ncbi:hypothetical protein [Haemophilus haemolyticus]|jgi:hypothetical protein|uniref:hypothetical protein n=1 Tax=Haemophilus haemolyticus TaxID=726 RepID=UPI000E571857|nr:hypothetical protein [Haemophilus haemolyticus]MBS6021354.1 hypothetical protein [Haemophilus haemolyticus]
MMKKKCLLLLLLFVASVIGLTSQIHKKNDALKRKNETILILKDKIGNRIINIDDYSKISSYVVINLINDNYMYIKEVLQGMAYKEINVDELCNKNGESINIFIDHELIKLVYVYPSSSCRE